MKKSIGYLFLASTLCLTSCQTEKKKDIKTIQASQNTNETVILEKTLGKADSLVDKAIKAHGGKRYDTAKYAFTFREKRYSFHNTKNSYSYTVTSEKNGDSIKDELANGRFTRTVNGVETELSEKDVIKYTEALNSVIYFATLPHKLNDAAVYKELDEQTTIEGQNYAAIAVTFDQDGGGTDHDDTFMYWINTKTNTIDYLGYSYATNDGGVRFRSAYNPRTIDGIRFQDYVNYEAPIGTPLNALPKLYEADKLKELSTIETEDVIVIKD